MLEFYTAYFDCGDVMAITEELIAAAARAGGGAAAVRAIKGRDGLVRARPSRRVTHEGRGRRGPRARPGCGLERDVLDDAGAPRAPGRRSDALRGRRDAQGPGAWTPERYAGAVPRQAHRPALRGPRRGRRSGSRRSSPTTRSRSRRWPRRARTIPPPTERFELYVAGMEIANGFSELNDPLEQRAALPRPARGAREGRRGGAPDGRGLRARPRPRPAAHRRLRRGHRPPGHDPHGLARPSAT